MSVQKLNENHSGKAKFSVGAQNLRVIISSNIEVEAVYTIKTFSKTF